MQLIGQSQLLEITLWIGFAGLTIALLALMRTRWGHAKTITKCVWLSILAHLLLGGLAYGTKFLWSSGSGTEIQTVAVHLVLDPIDADEEWVDQPKVESEPIDSLNADADLVEQSLADAEKDAESVLTDDSSTPEIEKHEAPQTALGSTQEYGVSETAANPPSPEPPLPPTNNEALHSSVAQSSPPALQVPKRVDSINVPDNDVKAVRESEIEPTAGKAHGTAVDAESRSKGETPTEISPPYETSMESVQSPVTSVNSEPETRTQDTRLSATESAFRHPTRHPLPIIYSWRSPDKRRAAVLANGGSETTELAVRQALNWLRDNQQPDGRWNPRSTGAGREQRVLGHDRQGAGGDADTALTGLALLAFLGAGHTHFEGDYPETVQKAVQFLIDSQHRNGHLAGDAGLFAHMYSHGIATLALSECLVLTGDPKLKKCVERAVDYSVFAQDPQSGSWRYLPKESGDMSQFGWQVMALKSAMMAGVQVPEATLTRMNHFLNESTTGSQGGLASYRPRQVPSETMSAEALLCRYFLGQPVPRAAQDEAISFFTRRPPGSAEVDYYLWYYATMALFQSDSGEWKSWNQALQAQLLRSQNRTGTDTGSWPANGRWCGYGGTVYSTAMATMCLEVYYRYLPITQVRSASR